MKNRVASIAVLLIGLAAFATLGLAQQDKIKRPSPPASAHCMFSDGKTLTVDYSSPRMKGREIYGGLVPYGKVWRTGANEATTFVTTANLTVGDKEVPAGSYTIFSIPEQGKWTLIISKKTGEFGIPYPGEQYDFARTPMELSNLKAPVEDFTISFVHSLHGCSMNLDWAETRATIFVREKQ
jgi:hypothetical protein